MNVDVARLVVVEEWNDSRFTVLDASHVGDQAGSQELLDPRRHGAIGVATDARPVGPGGGGGGGGGVVVRRGCFIHEGSLAQRPPAGRHWRPPRHSAYVLA